MKPNPIKNREMKKRIKKKKKRKEKNQNELDKNTLNSKRERVEQTFKSREREGEEREGASSFTFNFFSPGTSRFSESQSLPISRASIHADLRFLLLFFFCLSSLNFQPRVLILSVPVVASISSISAPNSPRV